MVQNYPCSDKIIYLSPKWRSHLFRSPWAKPDGLLGAANDKNPDERRDQGNTNDPPKKRGPGATDAGAEFLFHKIAVVEIFAGQVEGVLGGFIAPAAALVGTAMGTGFAAGGDTLTANGTITRWFEGHGSGELRIINSEWRMITAKTQHPMPNAQLQAAKY
jgi:hypothetical protein